MDLTTNSWSDYELIDHGDGYKMERIGAYLLKRPSPQSMWPSHDSIGNSQKPDAEYHRSSSGGGNWEFLRPIPESWIIHHGQLKILVKTTGFGHVGFFPEQFECWNYLRTIIGGATHPVRVLNLFAYSGISTLMMAGAGAEVTHVDGSKGAVTWANENRSLNEMESASIRWILDDVMKFSERELRRGNTYHGIILDPPSFGRGPKGQVWKLEEHLTQLMKILLKTLHDKALFVLLTTHSPQMSVPGMKNYLDHFFASMNGSVQCGHLLIDSRSRLPLPAGIYGLWHS